MYYVLPLPLSNPSANARLAGLTLLRIPEAIKLELATVKKFFICKPCPHNIISPIFLFRQGIEPSNLASGLSSLQFLNEFNQQVKAQSADDILISFANRHLSVANAMLLQNFFAPDVFERFNYVIDLKTALETCYYFGNTKIKNSKSLNAAAKEFGFTGNLDVQLQRVDAMYHIYNHLLINDNKIMTFLHGARASRICPYKIGRFMVHIDDNGALCLVKILSQSQDLRLLKVIKSNGKELKLQCINLDLAPLLAPIGILTKERQGELGFFLEQEQERINQVNFLDLLPKAKAQAIVSEHSDATMQQSAAQALAGTFDDSELPFYDAYFKRLSDFQRATFERLRSHDLRSELDLTTIADPQTKFGQQVMCYFVENYPDAIFEGQWRVYRRYCESFAAQRAPTIKEELQLLVNSVNHDDEKAVSLLHNISANF